MVLEILDNGISDNGILRRVANEDGGRTTALSLVAAAFGHFWCPRPLRGIVAHAFRVGNPGTLGSRKSASGRPIRVSGGPLEGRPAQKISRHTLMDERRLRLH